jgi:hypothetical protein
MSINVHIFGQHAGQPVPVRWWSAGGGPGSIGPAGDMGGEAGRELVLQISEKNKKIISQKYLDTQKYL